MRLSIVLGWSRMNVLIWSWGDRARGSACNEPDGDMTSGDTRGPGVKNTPRLRHGGPELRAASWWNTRGYTDHFWGAGWQLFWAAVYNYITCMREDHNITSRDKMMLTSAGVVSSESRIVGESHSENIGVNELLGWTLLLQQAICLEPGGGDTHYHEAQRRGWGVHCSVFPQCTLLQHGTVWMLPQLPGILTLTSCWPVNIDLGAQFVLGPHNIIHRMSPAKHNFS